MPSCVKARIQRLVESSLSVWLGVGSMVWISSGRLDLRVSAWGSGELMPMRLANQRVSGKVSNITATKRVMGKARKAPGPPRSQAQNTNERKTMVGEMLSPRLIIIGERTFSASMLITTTPR
jgi:hypothetical protein